jgi:hypothetical protein
MGLPHILVRFYTNPDGPRGAQDDADRARLLSAFYLFPAVYGVLGRVFTPHLYLTGQTDSVVLVLPEAMVGGLTGELLGALVAAGAFAAFLSTASGLLISVRRLGGLRPAGRIGARVPLQRRRRRARVRAARAAGRRRRDQRPGRVGVRESPRRRSARCSAGHLVARPDRGRRAPAACCSAAAPRRSASSLSRTSLGASGWPSALLTNPAAWSVPLASSR